MELGKSKKDTSLLVLEENSHWPSARQGWYLVFVLMMAFTLAFIDRIILSLLVESIKEDLSISDTQFSLLHGLAFAIFYALLGIPIARLADTRNRRNIIVVGVAVWSLMTALCGLAGRFWELFLFRMGVGVGEAALSPAAFSMIADSFPKARLGRAISVYSSGGFLGAGLALMIGGFIIGKFLSIGDVHVPIIGILAPWQITFIIVGIPGLLVAIWIATLREPTRRRDNMPQHSSLLELYQYVSKNRSTFAAHFIGVALLVMVNQGIYAWTPAYFIRVHNFSPSQVGYFLGAVTFVFGSAGIISGGYFADHLARRGAANGTIKVCLIAALAVSFFAPITTLVSNVSITMMLYCPLTYFISLPFGAAAAGVQWLSPASMRAQISAIYLFTVNLIGIGLGPTIVAVFTDYVFKSEASVGYSLAIVGFLAPLTSAFILFLGLKPFNKTASALL